MKVLLIGGTGTLSSDTTQLCIDRGYDVFLLNRGNRNVFEAENLHYLIGNINDVENTKKVLSEYSFDVVIDYLTYDVETLKKRIAVLGSLVKQYIFISSATVFSGSKGIIDENSPLDNDGWIYSKKKHLCEEYLHNMELPFQYTIVRPYVTYGNRRIPFPIISKNSFWNLIYRIENRLPILMCGDGNQMVTLTHTRDFAVGICGLFLNEQAYGESFNIVGNNVYTWNDVIRIIEDTINEKAIVINVPTEQLADEIYTLREELLFDKANSHIFNNEKILRVVPEFKSDITLDVGLRETIHNLCTTSSLHQVDEYWNAMENVLCKRHGYRNVRVTFRQRYLYLTREVGLMQKLKKLIKRQ